MRLRARWLLAGLLTAGLAACDSADERAAGHFQTAMELLEAGEDARANVEFRNVVQLQPDNVEARYQIAAFARSQNNIRGAVGQYRGVIELEPGHVRARRELAEIMLIANALEEASRNIEVAFTNAPDDVQVRAIKSAVDYRLALQDRTSPDAAVEMARGVVAEDATNTSARLVLAAYEMDAGRLEDALGHVDAGLVESPEDLSLNVVRLGVLEQLERLDDVGAQLMRLVELYPRTDQFRESLARWHLFKGEHDLAEAQYRAIAANNPDDEQRTLDVVRFLNAVHGEDRAREELERLAAAATRSVDYDFAIVALDLRDGEEAAAIARLERLIETRGETLEGDRARIERAKIHIRKEEFEPADALVTGVLSRDPKNANALLLRASRWLAADRPEAAIEDLRAALDVAPDNVQVVLLLATAYERNGNANLAQERLAQAVQLSGHDIGITLRYAQVLLADDKGSVAESVLREALNRRGDSRDLLVAYGQLKLRDQAWREAEAVAARLRRLDPEDPVAARLEAAALLGQDRSAEGTELLEGLMNADEADPSNMVSFVRALIAGGDLDRAKTFLDERLEGAPDDVTALLLMASIQSATGELTDAEANLKRVIELDADNASAYAALARIYNSQGRSELMSETLARGLEGSSDPSLRLTKAMQLEFEGRVDEALEIYSELYREQPNSLVVANNYASLLADHRADDPAEVERAFNIAKRFRSSRLPHMKDTYGWLLHLTGDTDGAFPLVMEAASELPTNPVVQYHAGVLLLAKGQLAQARERLERALELGEQVPFGQADKAEAALDRIARIEAERATGAAGATGTADE